MAKQRYSEDSGVKKTITVKRRLDRRIDPPMYVDEEIPSVSVIMGARATRGYRAPAAGTAEASYYVTGSLREFIPGTYGMRVTRVSIVAGSRGIGNTASALWYIRHSRDGTYDVIRFPRGGGHIELQGDAQRPVYSFGPGTILWAFAGTVVAGSRSMHLEGVPSARFPDQV